VGSEDGKGDVIGGEEVVVVDCEKDVSLDEPTEANIDSEAREDAPVSVTVTAPTLALREGGSVEARDNRLQWTRMKKMGQ